MYGAGTMPVSDVRSGRLRCARAVAVAVTAIAVALPTGSAAAAPPQGALGGPGLHTAGVVTGSPRPLPAPLSAASWVLADLDSGAVLAARNPHGRFAPASTLKMLTAVTVIPQLPRTHRII